MSPANNDLTNESPKLTPTVQEVQGRFPNDAALQDALAQLTLAGFDRADFSLPEDQPASRDRTPDQGADNPPDEIDQQQVRTMTSSLASGIGAMAAAGATVATGGAAAAAAAAAAAVGVGTGALVSGGEAAADQGQIDERDREGAAGHLVLAVRTIDEQKMRSATEVMQKAGATSVQPVSRSDQTLTAGVSSASWTGG